MINRALNTLEYSGIVTISQRIGNKKIEICKVHNTGGNSLFNFLTDCLVGDFDIAKLNQPKKIMLLRKVVDEVNIISYEDISGFIGYISKPEKISSDKGSTVRYSFIVSKAMVENVEDITDKIGIGLYSESTTDPENFAAYCEMPFNKNEISNSAILVIDWDLNISNKESDKIIYGDN